jgi:tetratricopeptide (TPR) repeat protein
MKRILFICSLFLGLHAVNGQESIVSSESTFNSMTKKIQKSDQEIQDPKKNISSKTWLNRGTLFQDAYDINNLKYIRKGMTGTELKVYFKEPTKIEAQQLSSGTKQEKYNYYGFTVVLENDKVTDFYDTKSVDDNALDKAFEAFVKARQLDAEKKIDKKLKSPLELLRDQYRRASISNFEKEKYAAALKNFESILAIDTIPIVHEVDTVVTYYAGLAGFFAKDYKTAIKYLNQTKELHWKEPKVFYYIEQSFLSLGDTATAMNSIKEGYKLYPTDNVLVIELVNVYIKLNEANQALEYLNKAKVLDPKNKTLYFAEGSLYDKVGKPDSAKAAYENALKLDPEYFDATYNLGVFYYNSAVKLYEEANKEADNKKYLEKKAVADEELKKAVPVMEKAHQINPTDPGTMQTLKTLYYRLKIDDKLKQIKQELGEK